MTTERASRVIDEIEAAAQVKDGMCIVIGGHILSSHPMPVIRQIIKQGTKNLTVVGAASASLEVDLLIGAGCARKVIAPYVGAEALAPIGPFFKAAAERGEIALWECDEGIYYTALRKTQRTGPRRRRVFAAHHRDSRRNRSEKLICVIL